MWQKRKINKKEYSEKLKKYKILYFNVKKKKSKMSRES